MLGLDAAALAVVDESAATAEFAEARLRGVRMEWLVGRTMDLRSGPSGIASVVGTGEPFAVVDAPSSPRVSSELVERTGARSVVFVPLRTPERVAGVLVGAAQKPRVFAPEEVELLQALAGEGALALERVRSAVALQEALERERLIARIGADMRSALDLDAVLDVTARELGVALGLSRCLVRLGDQLAAEWSAEGLEPVGGGGRDLPVTNLAQSGRRTTAVADVDTAPELDAEERDRLLELGSRAALATPIDVDGETIGVLALHRAAPGAWPAGSVATAEAVADEAGLAIRTARLLDENRRRLAEQTALLDASQALTSELHIDSVLQRIVDELSRLLRVDAADCWIFDEQTGRLRCRAVRGLPETEVGRTIAPEGNPASAIETRRPVLKRQFAETEDPPPSASYAPFAEAIDAPISAGGDVRGVLGVCSLTADRFDEDDLRLLDAFARLAGIALRNAEAFEESTRLAQVQQGFFRIASVLGEPLSAVSTLDAVAQAAAEALGGDAAAVLLRPVGERLELAGSYEIRPELRSLLAAQGRIETLERAATEHRVLAAPHVAADERFAGWHAALAAADARSLLAIPVEEAREQRGGLVVVIFTEVRTFSDDDLELAHHARRRGARRARAQRGLRARAARPLARAAPGPHRAVLTTELDPDGRARRDPTPGDAAARGRRGVDPPARGRRARRPRRGRPWPRRRPRRALPATGGSSGTSSSRARRRDRGRAADERAAAPIRCSPRAYARLRRRAAARARGNVARRARRLCRASRGRGARRRSRRCSRSREARPRRCRTRSSTSASRSRRSGASRSSPTSPTASSPSTARARSCSGTRAAERDHGRPGGRGARSHAGAGAAAARSSVEGDAPGGDRLVPIARGGEEVWLSVTEAVMRDPAGAVAGRIFAFRDISADASSRR